MLSGNNLRFAIRGLVRNPRHSLLVVAVLALGIGANTAIFSVVYAVLLKPLPYPEPERLVTFYDKIPQFQRYILNSAGSYLRWRQAQDVFSEMAAFRNRSAVFTEQGPPVSLDGAAATASLFRLLEPPLLMGRGFNEEEDRPGGAEVVLIREGLWRTRFGGDPSLLGRQIRLDGVTHSVIGVFPDSFLFPPPLNLRGRMVRSDADFLVPLRANAEDVARRGLFVMARLRDGVSLRKASQRLQVTARELARKNAPGQDREGHGAAVFSLHTQAVSDSKTLLMVLTGAVLLVLLIACLNVANLQLARATERRQELAVCAAMGAGPGSLLRQVLAESLLMALVAGLCGAAAAAVSLQ
ncbi:MAG TPA: ABC transporter permease, partial [Acidobacteriota bacterium]|nr:ABC transporter permease [Acidobacteriota bacterium]